MTKYNYIILLIGFIPVIAAMSLFFIPKENFFFQKNLSIFFAAVSLILSVYIYKYFDIYNSDFQFFISIFEVTGLNIGYELGIDSLSLWFIILTNLLTFVCLVYINKAVVNRKYFFSLLFFIQFFVLQSFMVLDIFMFYIFFESILLPMFFVIGVWGSYNRNLHASFLFFLYTLFGSLLMLLGIQFFQIEVGSTNFSILAHYPFSFYSQLFLFIVFFISFGIKVPIVPVHIWLPEAHGEAPTIGSVILAGILLKLGLYGFLRIIIPCCPDALLYFRSYIYLIGILAVTYTALATLAQTDLKRIIAYSSVGHMNLSVLGLISLSVQGIEGSLFSLISHGFVSSGLFICVGLLYDRYGTKLVSYYGSFVSLMPIFSFCFFILTFSNLAFPGTSAFVGELLTFIGISSVNIFLFIFSSLSVIFVAIYSVWTYNRVIFGPNLNLNLLNKFADLTTEEFISLILLIIPILFFGIYPDPILSTIHVAILNLNFLI